MAQENYVTFSNSCGKARKVEINLNMDDQSQLAIPVQDAPTYTQTDEKRLKGMLHKLEKAKEASYRCAQEAFSKQLNKISIQKDKELKKATNCLIHFMKDIKQRLHDMENYDLEMNALKAEWDDAVDDWRCEVDSITKKQSNGCKILLANFKNNLLNCHHFPKPLVNQEISHFVKEINNIIMSNERMYAETEIHLKLLLENLIQEWLVQYSLNEIKKECKVMAGLEKDEGKLDIPSDNKNVETISVDSTIIIMVDCLAEYCKQEMPTFIMTSKLAMYLSHLDSCKEKICILNHETIFTVKNHVEKTMNNVNNDNNEDFKALWCDVIALVGEKIVESYKFVRDSIDIWNRFINRLKSTEYSSSRNIEIHRMNVHKQMQDSGENLNIAIDKLRQAKSLESLNSSHDNFIKLLDGHETICFEERCTVETYTLDFVNACFLLVDMYSAEMTVMRGETLPKGKQKIPQFMSNSYSENEEDENILTGNLNDIQLCMLALQNWLDGYKEIITVMEKEIVYFVGTFVENWMDLKRGEADFWYNLEAEKITQRKIRIKNDIYEVRASELRVHESIISRHRRGVRQMYSSLKLLPHTLFDRIRAIDTDIERTSNELYSALEQNPIQANFYMGKIETVEATGKAKKNQLRERLGMELERAAYWIKHSTCSLLKAISLFGEGGNFSAEEAEVNVKTLMKDLRTLNTLKNDICRKLNLIHSEPPRARRAIASMFQFVMKAEEHNLIQSCNNILDNLKRALKIEIFNAKTFINKIQGFSVQARKNPSTDFWKNSMSEINFFCKYFELPFTSMKLEHESKSVYRGIYKPNTEPWMPPKYTSKEPKKNLSKHVQKRGKRSETSSLDLKEGSPVGNSKTSSCLSIRSDKNYSLYAKRIAKQRNKSTGYKKSKASTCKYWGPVVCSVEQGERDGDSESDDFQLGTFQMDFGAKGHDQHEREVQHAYPYPPLFYYTSYIKSMELDNYLCNTKTLMMEAFNDIKSKIINLASKMKSEKKYILVCGDLIHKYIIKIRKFNLQIEHVWFEMIYAFLCALIGFQEGINFVTTNFFENFLCQLETKKDAIIGGFARQVELEDLKGQQAKELIEKELKPSFGYPLNLALLEGLIIKVLLFSAEESTRRKNALKNFDVILQEANTDLTEVLTETYEKIDDINKYLTENENVTSFVRQIYSYMFHLSKKNINKDIKEYLFIKSNTKGRVMDSLEDSVESFDVILGNKSVVKYIDVTLQFIMQITQGSGVLIDTDAIFVSFPNACEELRLQVEEYKQKMENFDKEETEKFKAKCAYNENELKEWKLKWCHDVKCIRKLYVVKDIFRPLYP